MFFFYILLKVILILLLSIFFILTIILLIPFYYDSKITVDNGWSLKFRMEWGKVVGIGGKFDKDERNSINILLFGKKLKFPLRKSKLQDRKNKKEANLTRKENVKKIRKGFPLKSTLDKFKDLVDREFIRTIIEYIKSIIEILSPKSIYADIIYGFDDPYITGIVSGFANYINYFYPNAIIKSEANFTEEIFVLYGGLAGKICVGRIFFRSLLLIFNKNVFWKIISFRKKETFD